MQESVETEADRAYTEYLFESNLEFAELMARRFIYRHGVPSHVVEDVKNAALVGIWQAAQRYDVRHGCSFRTYSAGRIVGAMIDELRSWDYVSRGERRTARAECREPRGMCSNLGPDDLGVAPDHDGKIVDLLDGMVGVEKELCDMLATGSAKKDVAERFGMSRSWVTLRVSNLRIQTNWTRRARV